MKQKLKLFGVVGGILTLFAFGVITPDFVLGWVRYAFYSAKAKVTGERPLGSLAGAQACRENLHRIQAAKRKAAQDRGNSIGAVTWEEVLTAMRGSLHGLTSDQINALIPKCPDGGTYSIGTLEEVPRCSISGNGTVSSADDHIIRD